jgi:glycosyltransferase involved in cell wall biosynthesis
MSYAALMAAYRYGWEEQGVFKTGQGRPKTSISVVIPARNEETNIGACVQAILDQNYPKELLEIIVVDDHSTDHTLDVVESFEAVNLHCISLSEHISESDKLVAYKKKALSVGISKARGELIVTTDADCVAPTRWLKNIAAKYEAEQAVMIVAPVDFSNNGKLVETFQSIDFMSMQGITAAVHQLSMGNMSNGANLAFSKEAFYEVEGYAGIDHLASGDDFLLMTKLGKAYPGRISYLKSKDAIVRTAPQPDWKSFFNQRIRWASKSGKYDDQKMTAMLALVYLFNLSFLLLLIGGFFFPFAWAIGGMMLLWKIIAEIYYLLPVAEFFGKTRELYIYPLLQPLHILYIISAGFLGMVGKYQWKGRRVN